MDRIISEDDGKKIKSKLDKLSKPVKIIFFTQEIECQLCKSTHQMMDELAAISDKLSLEVYNFVINKDIAEAYGIDKIPATVIEGEKDYGIRFYGIPAGYEFTTLIETIIMVSKGDSGLNENIRTKVKIINKPVHSQVLITPT